MADLDQIYTEQLMVCYRPSSFVWEKAFGKKVTDSLSLSETLDIIFFSVHNKEL